MELNMIDVTGIEGVKAGDIVTVFGEDGDECVPCRRTV
jgi:alanine racemase